MPLVLVVDLLRDDLTGIIDDPAEIAGLPGRTTREVCVSRSARIRAGASRVEVCSPG